MSALKQIGTLQYMGSKSRIIEHICKPIVSSNDITRVVDLFAGTGSVSYALQGYKDIVSNDIEYYSYVINQAILNGCNLPQKEEQTFWAFVESQHDKISKEIRESIYAEESFFVSDVNYEDYRLFCENTPSVFSRSSDDNRLTPIKKLVSKVIPGNKPKTQLPCLFLTYYANAYFGIKQCSHIDAIASAIHSISNRQVQYVLLAVLMSVMSATASTTTHFAQYLKVKDKITCNNLIEKRKVDLISEMRRQLNEYREAGLLERKQDISDCYNLDYIDCLESVPMDSSTLVYADPPYFKEHYSRYYHILNTLCLYDYPDISINPQTHMYAVGRYRVGRSVSNFGKRSMALEAFSNLINSCADAGAQLMISYSDNSIVNIDDLRSLVEKRFNVKIRKVDLNHSNQGRASCSKVGEYLFSCRPINSLAVIGEKLKLIKEIKPIVDNPAGFMHNYMARKPHNIVSAIIDSFTPANGTVYDPMVGSGTTLIEASKLGRKAIGADINPVAYKICKASLTGWNVEKVFFLFDSFCSEVKRTCEHLYVFNEGNESRLIERCHFNQKDDQLIPTLYWYKKFLKNGELSGRVKAEASENFISSYNSFYNYQITNIDDKRLLPNSRIAIKHSDSVYKYFCNRNLVAMDIIIDVLNRYRNDYGYELLELLVSSSLNLIKLSDKKASSQMPYWIPKTNVTSRNANFIVEQKVLAFKEGLLYLRENCKHFITDNSSESDDGVFVYNTAAQTISHRSLPNDSIDLILTDPPYIDQVPYLEYSQLWDSVFRWKAMTENTLIAEMVVSDAPSRKKDINDFNSIFSHIISRAGKSLKHNGFFIMFYHTFNLKSWSHIFSLMREQGLSYCHQIPIAAPRKSFKAIMSPKSTLDGNYVVVFQKNDFRKANVFNGSLDDAKYMAVECARRIITSGIDVTTQELYDRGMLRDAFEEGYINILADSYKSLAEVISGDFECIDGLWREQLCTGF